MIIARKFRVRVGNDPNAYYFTIAQDEWGHLSVTEIVTPHGPMKYCLPLPQNVVTAMCDAMAIVESGAGCIDPINGSTGVTGVTSVTGNQGCSGFTFL